MYGILDCLNRGRLHSWNPQEHTTRCLHCMHLFCISVRLSHCLRRDVRKVTYCLLHLSCIVPRRAQHMFPRNCHVFRRLRTRFRHKIHYERMQRCSLGAPYLPKK
eukprot:PhF_6_TR6073/c0_g1_i7/m.8834